MLLYMLYNLLNATSVEIENSAEKIKKYQKIFDIYF